MVGFSIRATMAADVSLNFFTDVSARKATIIGFFDAASVAVIVLFAASIDLITTPIVLNDPKPMLSALMPSGPLWPSTRIWSPVRTDVS